MMHHQILRRRQWALVPNSKQRIGVPMDWTWSMPWLLGEECEVVFFLGGGRERDGEVWKEFGWSLSSLVKR